MTLQAFCRLLIVRKKQLRQEFTGVHSVDVLALSIIKRHHRREIRPCPLFQIAGGWPLVTVQHWSQLLLNGPVGDSMKSCFSILIEWVRQSGCQRYMNST